MPSPRSCCSPNARPPLWRSSKLWVRSGKASSTVCFQALHLHRPFMEPAERMACCLLPSALQLPPPWNFISRPLCKLFPHSKCHLCCLHGRELSLFVQNVTGFQLSSVASALLDSCNSPWPHCPVSQFQGCKVEGCILAWELQIYAWSFATQSQSEGSFLALFLCCRSAAVSGAWRWSSSPPPSW